MFEPKHHPLLPRHLFLRRFVRNWLLGLALIGVSLAGGMAGYEYFEGMSMVDAFVNASMILSGMGPMGDLRTTGGKIFAGCYALYSGLALITVAAITLSPVFHRFLHRFHLEVHRQDAR